MRTHVRAFVRACVCACVRSYVRAYGRACVQTYNKMSHILPFENVERNVVVCVSFTTIASSYIRHVNQDDIIIVTSALDR